eukprot:TRINITY_DN52079_c0_g1_i1.p2 TRINITY_DN52079_c0_g1~~TRINITY_DN52079_c0_g1_i1.p2  ORF type:complete len:208 (-),score=45.27 TRINITY_DN52079_c0_g1_i1:1585-2208(-)
MQAELDYKDKRFRNGVYKGSYFDAAGDDEKAIELDLIFEGAKVSGSGTADGYTLTISGKYTDKAPYDFTVTLEELGLVLTGARNQQAQLQGRWKHNKDASLKGLFELTPVGKLTPDQAVDELVAMGFARDLANKAVIEQKMRVDVAAEWLASGCPEIPGAKVTETEADTAHIQTITEMGFTEDQAKNALIASGNNVEAAIAMLVSNA